MLCRSVCDMSVCPCVPRVPCECVTVDAGECSLSGLMSGLPAAAVESAADTGTVVARSCGCVRQFVGLDGYEVRL